MQLMGFKLILFIYKYLFKCLIRFLIKVKRTDSLERQKNKTRNLSNQRINRVKWTMLPKYSVR
jgi:hypothetical protein